MKTVRVVGMLITTAVIFAFGGSAWAGPDQARQPSAWDETPQTVEEHLARAAFFRQKASSYRAEAETHRKMIAKHEKQRAHPIHKTTSRRKAPWIAKMRTRYEGYIEPAELFATEADRIADFYQMRGEGMSDTGGLNDDAADAGNTGPQSRL